VSRKGKQSKTACLRNQATTWCYAHQWQSARGKGSASVRDVGVVPSVIAERLRDNRLITHQARAVKRSSFITYFTAQTPNSHVRGPNLPKALIATKPMLPLRNAMV